MFQMKTSIQIGALAESDLDLVLLLELAADHKFAKWLASRIPGWHYGQARLLQVRRSVDTTNGETDLELTFVLPRGRTLQILVENKIAANLQPRQLERYRERANAYSSRAGHANAFVAVLSPAKYHLTQNENFDAHITYEECVRYLEIRATTPCFRGVGFTDQEFYPLIGVNALWAILERPTTVMVLSNRRQHAKETGLNCERANSVKFATVAAMAN